MNKRKNTQQAKKQGKEQTKSGSSKQQGSSLDLRSKINEFRTFLDQSKYEMKKVTYPSQKQTLTTCGSVLFIVTVIALFLGIVDVVFAQILEIFLP
jgi:preprotein translocase subunit SecE